MSIYKKLLVVMLGALGVGLIWLGFHLAPSDAFEIQTVFRDSGEQTKGTVLDKGTSTHTYVKTRGRQAEYDERWVRVRLEGSRRSVTISQLVLPEDFEALSAGDTVSITFIRDKAAVEALPDGPYYLLTNSVEVGSYDLLGWAFDGRPLSGWFIFGLIGGIVVLLITMVLTLVFRFKDSNPESDASQQSESSPLVETTIGSQP